MRCRECAAETADGNQFCPRCGASVSELPSAAEDMVTGRPGQGPEVAPAVSRTAQSGRAGDVSLRVVAGLVAGAGLASIIWACALPVVTRPTASIFSIRSIWLPAQPVAVAVLGACAGIVMMTARRGSGLRWLAAGTLLASGAQIGLFFEGLEFGGVAGRLDAVVVVGVIGGVMLVAAGVLGAVGNAARRGVLAVAASGRTRYAQARARMRVAAGIPAAAGTVLVIWACMLPSFTFQGAPISYFGGLVIGLAFEPVAVAVIGLCASIAVVAARPGPGLRLLAAGMLVASGTETFVYFASWQFTASGGPAYGPGSADVVGMIGAVVLAAAGVLGAASNVAGRAAVTAVADGAAGPAPSQPDVPGPGRDIPAGIRSVLRSYSATGSAAALGSAGFISASLYQHATTTWPDVRSQGIIQHPVLLAAVALIGVAAGLAGIVVFIQRSRFSRLVRKPGNPSRGTVTASHPGRRALTLDAPCGGYLPALSIRLAWGTEPRTLPSGQSVTFYGRPAGVGPLLLTASEPDWSCLGTGKRRAAVPAGQNTLGRAGQTAGSEAAQEGRTEAGDA
jgi:hypothetical protein